MTRLIAFIQYIRWPALIGFVLALTYLTLSGKQSIPSVDRYNDNRGPVSYSAAVKRASPSVVNIYTRTEIRSTRVNPLINDPYFKRHLNRQNLPHKQALGSGVIVSEHGYILTSFHVVEGADEIAVALQDGRETQATIVGTNRERDLAVLRIPLDQLPVISVGDINTAQVGDVVLAIGNPLGIGQTVTQGIISATQRRDLNISLFEGFIQTDAAINPGNSGGALIDANGNLLGINTAKADEKRISNDQLFGGGIGFAVPVDIAMQTLEDVIEYGRVVRGWLGVEARLLTAEIAANLNIPITSGILVTRIDQNSPAARAGFRPGDVIVGINNERTDNILEGWQTIAESRPGETVIISVLRDTSVINLQATLGELPTTQLLR